MALGRRRWCVGTVGESGGAPHRCARGQLRGPLRARATDHPILSISWLYSADGAQALPPWSDMTEETPRPRPAPRGDLHTQFAGLPDPVTLSARRADRFIARAEGHELAPY